MDQKDSCVFLRVATNALFMAFPDVHDVCYVQGRWFATFLSWGSLGHLILRAFPRGVLGGYLLEQEDIWLSLSKEHASCPVVSLEVYDDNPNTCGHKSNFRQFSGATEKSKQWQFRGFLRVHGQGCMGLAAMESPWVLEYTFCYQTVTQTHLKGDRFQRKSNFRKFSGATKKPRGNLCTARALRATFRLCSPGRSHMQTQLPTAQQKQPPPGLSLRDEIFFFC